jgi:polyisoprenoid-binding protein YceI
MTASATRQALAPPATAARALREFDLDPAHSSAEFGVKHLMIATVKGRMKIPRGTVRYDARDPAATLVEADVDVASIDTGAPDRDAHLRSPDFFDAAQHPTMRFVATHAEPTGEGAGQLAGELTIRGVTRPVVLDVEMDGEADDPWGKHRVALTARATLDRTEWGLAWNKALETGGVLVGDKVKVELHVSLVERAPQPSA